MSHKIVNIYDRNEFETLIIYRGSDGTPKTYRPTESSKGRFARAIAKLWEQNTIGIMSNQSGSLFWYSFRN